MHGNRNTLKVLQMVQPGKELARKIHDRSARVGVIGLGYVGLPLIIEMAKAGLLVTGLDIDSRPSLSVSIRISYNPWTVW